MTAARFSEYCSCGAGITLVGANDDVNEVVLNFWRSLHAGGVHQERVTPSEAEQLRNTAMKAMKRLKASSSR